MGRILATVGVCALVGGWGRAEPPRGLDYSTVGVYATCFDFCDYGCFKIRVSEDGAYLPHMAERLSDATANDKLNLVGLYCFDRVKHAKPIAEYTAAADRILDAIDLGNVHAFFLGEENVTWNKGLDVLNALYDHVKSRTTTPVYQWYSMPMVHHPKQRADGWIIDPYGMRGEPFRRYLMKFVVLGKPVIDCLHASPEGRYAFHKSDVHEATEEQIAVCREFNVPMFFYCVDKRYGSPAIWLHSDDPETAHVREWLLGEISKIRATDTATLPATSADYSTGHPIPVAGDRENQFAFGESFAALNERCFIDDAFINGFLMLRWDGEAEALYVKERRPGRDAVELIYHFVSEFELSRMTATLKGNVGGVGARASVAISINGHRFEHSGSTTAEGVFSLGSDSAGNAEFVGKEFWVRVRAEAGDGSGEPVRIDEFGVRCHVAPPERREIALAPGPDGNVAYADDFQTQKHLHIAEIANLEELVWERGYVGTHGTKGKSNVVTLKQKFVCAKPVSEIRVAMDSTGHRALGSFNGLGLSLDGQEPLLSETSRGKEEKEGKAEGRYKGTLELDASSDSRFAAATTFWVHLSMANTCGAETRTSNRITGYRVSATSH